MKYQLIHFRSQSLLACFAAASLMTRVAAAEVFINFDAHADGTPFSGQYGQIAFTEYASLGLTLSTIGSQNSMANVIASNPANVGSPFSGFGLSASFPGTGGAVSILSYDLRPLVLLFVLSGSLMISKTVHIPKP